MTNAALTDSLPGNAITYDVAAVDPTRRQEVDDVRMAMQAIHLVFEPGAIAQYESYFDELLTLHDSPSWRSRIEGARGAWMRAHREYRLPLTSSFGELVRLIAARRGQAITFVEFGMDGDGLGARRRLWIVTDASTGKTNCYHGSLISQLGDIVITRPARLAGMGQDDGRPLEAKMLGGLEEALCSHREVVFGQTTIANEMAAVTGTRYMSSYWSSTDRGWYRHDAKDVLDLTSEAPIYRIRTSFETGPFGETRIERVAIGDVPVQMS